MGGGRVHGALLAFAFVIGSCVLTATPAFADGVPPTTVPAIDAPLDGAQVSGDVVVSTSDAAATFVQFYLDGVEFGTPVPVVAGAAATDWPTWGLANSASHAWTAADCNDTGCNLAQSAAVTVTINNAAPTLDAPADTATTGPTPELDASSADGGGVEFLVDGNLVGFDASAPYSVVVANALTEGAHSAVVTACDTTGTVCNGPASAASGFTVVVLHPSITAVSPNPFSPNHDRRDDTTSFRVSLPDAENVSYVIRDHNGALVKSPHAPGELGAGNHTFTWGGTNNAGAVAPSGIYTIVVSTSAVQGAFTAHGSATRTVTLDNIAPTLSHMTGNGFTFYPVVDHYLDDFVPKVTVSEPGALSLYIFNSAGRTIRVMSGTHAAAGTVQLTWNGRNSGGAMMPAGTYRYEFVAFDKAGNRRASARDLVHVSLKHLVNRTATYTLNGDQREGVQTTNTSCTAYSLSLSSFAHGIWIDNVCGSSPKIEYVQSAYHLTVPVAQSYASVHVKSYGNTISAPEHIFGGVYSYGNAQWEALSVVGLPNNANRWSDFGSRNAAGLVSGRTLHVAVVVPSVEQPEDYDVGLVRVIVGYNVLV